MKNNLIKFFLYIFLSLTLTLQSSSNEVINLNVTLIEISENGEIVFLDECKEINQFQFLKKKRITLSLMILMMEDIEIVYLNLLIKLEI